MRVSSGRHVRRRSGRARAVVVAATMLLPLGVAGGAYAYWSAVGTGDATISSTTAQPLGVNAVATPFNGLFPGLTKDLDVVLSNPNSYPVSLTELTAVTVTSSDETACPGGTYISLPAEVSSGVAAGGYALPSAISVAAGSTSIPATIANLITMTPDAPDACQGKSFIVRLSFAGAQA